MLEANQFFHLNFTKKQLSLIYWSTGKKEWIMSTVARSTDKIQICTLRLHTDKVLLKYIANHKN